MPDEPFMLVSLEEAKAKKLAQVLNNETCTKILNYLARGKDGTETEISEALKLPLSTVHYNLKQLVDSRLVVADEYHYSAKGREVNHYKLANKYIIIAPQEERESFMKKLRQFLPAAAITAGVAIILKLLGVLNGTLGVGAGAPQASLAKAADMVAPLAAEPAAGGARLMAAAMPEAVNEATNVTAAASNLPPTHPGFAIWLSNEVVLAFLVGGLFALGLFAFFAWLRGRKAR